jgi:hypothetical protein
MAVLPHLVFAGPTSCPVAPAAQQEPWVLCNPLMRRIESIAPSGSPSEAVGDGDRAEGEGLSASHRWDAETRAGRHSASPERRPQAAPAGARKPAIVTTASRKRATLMRAEQAAKPDEDPEATARVRAFLARMIRPRGA